MGRARITIEPIASNSKKDRYLAKDLSVLAKKRLKTLKFVCFSLSASIILNIYLFLR